MGFLHYMANRTTHVNNYTYCTDSGVARLEWATETGGRLPEKESLTMLKKSIRFHAA